MAFCPWKRDLITALPRELVCFFFGGGIFCLNKERIVLVSIRKRFCAFLTKRTDFSDSKSRPQATRVCKHTLLTQSMIVNDVFTLD